jgi:hypothetical protein
MQAIDDDHAARRRLGHPAMGRVASMSTVRARRGEVGTVAYGLWVHTRGALQHPSEPHCMKRLLLNPALPYLGSRPQTRDR